MNRLLRAYKALVVNNLPANSMSEPDDTGFHASQLTADDLRNSSVVAAPLLWIARSFRMLEVQLEGPDGQRIEGHPIERILSGGRLMGAIADNYFRFGNVYLFLERNGSRGIEGLEFRDGARISPRWTTGAEPVTYYDWYPPGPVQRRVTVLEEELLHIRNGISPDNPVLGCSPLDGVLAEISVDLQAAGFSKAVLKNMGVIGNVVSPDESDIVVRDEDLEKIKTEFDNAVSGTKRGSTVVMRAQTKVQQIRTDLTGAALAPIRNISEERVTAALGLPAAVIGFGAGLEQTKVGATMRELRRQAWEDCSLPSAEEVKSQIGEVLLPEFGLDPERGYRLRLDTLRVEALQANRLDEARRVVLLTSGMNPVISEASARSELGYDDDDAPSEQQTNPNQGTQANQTGTEGTRGTAPSNGNAKGSPASTRKQEPYQHEMIRRLDESFGYLRADMERSLVPIFMELGEAAAKFADRIEPKAEKQDEQLAEIINEALGADIAVATERLSGAYNGAYAATLHQVYRDTSAVIGITIGVPDQEQVRILAEGGTRLGLIDLDQQTRRAVFNTISEARAESLGPQVIARRLRDNISSGPHWLTAKTRAEVIARTEVKHAQRTSSLSAYRTSGRVDRVLLFDARLGNTDAECHARDNTEVSFREAQELADIEHPNGSLDMAPVIN